MNIIRICGASILLINLLSLVGCATIRVNEAVAGKPPDGIRIYPPKVYLLVDTCAKKSRLMYAPDFANAYDVKPLTIFAKQDFTVELDEGQLKKLVSSQDTTAFLTFLQGAAEIAAKAFGTGVSSTSIDGTFGLADGIWMMDATGHLQARHVVHGRTC